MKRHFPTPGQLAHPKVSTFDWSTSYLIQRAHDDGRSSVRRWSISEVLDEFSPEQVDALADGHSVRWHGSTIALLDEGHAHQPSLFES